MENEEIIPEKSDVDKRREEYEALKTQNDNVEAELLRREQLKAKIAEGGKSETGQTEVKKEETAKEYADRVMGGGVKND